MIGNLPLILWAHGAIWWWLVPVVLALIAGTWYVHLSRNKLAKKLDKTGTLLKHFSSIRNIIKATLASGAFLGIFLALLHPQWGHVNDKVEQRGRDLIVALDISRSMLVQDVKPDRLTCAKNIIKDLVQKLETDRVALMVFSEKARIYCPLTQDRELVSLFLDQIDHTTLSSGTTLLDQPVLCALEQCERQPDRKHKLLVLVTDGEDFSHALSPIKERAISAGLTILVVGIGTSQGAPIPVYNEKKERIGYLKDVHDRVVVSQLNKFALSELAKETGGRAIFVEKDTVLLEELVNRIKQFDKERQEMAIVPSLKEQYPWFLLTSFVCMLLEWVL